MMRQPIKPLTAIRLLLHLSALFLAVNGSISEKSIGRQATGSFAFAGVKRSVKGDMKYFLSPPVEPGITYSSNTPSSESQVFRENAAAGLQGSAEAISSFLHDFVNRELGVNETKNFYETTSYEARSGQGLEEQVNSLADSFSAQIESYYESVDRLVESVRFLSVYNESLQLEKCCELAVQSFIYDADYKLDVRRDTACWSASSVSKNSLFVPSLFNQAMLKNSAKVPHIKWQYFVSPEGVYVEYPANNHNCKTSKDTPRPVFTPKTHSERKMWLIQKPKGDSRIHRIVFLIQLGRSPTFEMIKSVKDIILLLLRFLDEADEVGILNVDADDVWTDFLCDQLVPVTSWSRYQILSYLNYIEERYKSSSQQQQSSEEQSGVDMHTALSKSIQMACANFTTSPIFPPSAATIIHLTSEAEINKNLGVLKSGCPIFIESYFVRVLANNEEVLYRAHLKSGASKNIWNIQVNSMSQMDPESFAIKVALKLNSKKEWWSLSDILSQFFPEETEKPSASTEFSIPHWNPVSKEPVIVAKKYVFQSGQPLGLVAVEIPVIYFIQHITYFINENFCNVKNYAFLIDVKGRVISHPALGRADSAEEALTPIQIEQVEVYHGFAVIRQKLLSPDVRTGCQSLRIHGDWVTYAWSRVHGYIVVLVAFGNSGGCIPDREELILRKSSLSPKSDLQDHLLLKKTHCCNNQEFSITKASLYLSPSAFANPASASSFHPQLKQNVKQSLALLAYLSDNSGLLQNQNKGLLPAVKDHVGMLSNIIPIWKQEFQSSPWSKYIQHRFASGGGGTFLLTYPGITLMQARAPHSSSWFRNGVIGDEDLVVTSPVLNSRGVPTSSMSVLVKVPGGGKEVPVAVLGSVVSIGFFQKLLEEIVPECRYKDRKQDSPPVTRCFLLDDGGYVVYHPNLAKMLQSSRHPHITQMEPLSVIDILQYGLNATQIPMRKQTCHKVSKSSATQESLHRFYTLHMSPRGISKSKHGEMCSRYQLLPLQNTNLFLGVVHDNCSSAAAFCPCSTVDNICLNCLRIEPSDCECPCECPREPNFCSKQGFTDLPQNVEPCHFPLETAPLEGSACGIQNSCKELWTPCQNITEQGNCIGVHDCEWCVNYGTAKCMNFQECYGYLQGKLDGDDGHVDLRDESSVDASSSRDGQDGDNNHITIVPILGVLAVFLFFLCLVVYCYRHRALRSSSSQPDVHLLPLQESPMGSVVPQAGSSRSSSDAEEPIPVYIRNHNRRDVNFPPPPRSPLGSAFTESDHGYSTMTHNEDSESGVAFPVMSSIEPLPRRLLSKGSPVDTTAKKGTTSSVTTPILRDLPIAVTADPVIQA